MRSRWCMEKEGFIIIKGWPEGLFAGCWVLGLLMAARVRRNKIRIGLLYVYHQNIDMCQKVVSDDVVHIQHHRQTNIINKH